MDQQRMVRQRARTIGTRRQRSEIGLSPRGKRLGSGALSGLLRLLIYSWCSVVSFGSG